MGAKAKLEGQRFGMLVALLPIKNKFGRREWLCRCDCGAHQGVGANALMNGDKKSCGCLYEAHGKTQSSEYTIWTNMRTRCNNPRDRAYKWYGARGIKVCAAWDNFSVFLADMGPRPSPLHTVDRINNDGNYEKSNCRWATKKEQSRNKRNNVLITHNGETKCVADWALSIGMDPSGLRGRLRSGWPVDVALTTPPKHSRQKAAQPLP